MLYLSECVNRSPTTRYVEDPSQRLWLRCFGVFCQICPQDIWHIWTGHFSVSCSLLISCLQLIKWHAVVMLSVVYYNVLMHRNRQSCTTAELGFSSPRCSICSPFVVTVSRPHTFCEKSLAAQFGVQHPVFRIIFLAHFTHGLLSFPP